jgi:hypothetical protein
MILQSGKGQGIALEKKRSHEIQTKMDKYFLPNLNSARLNIHNSAHVTGFSWSESFETHLTVSKSLNL